MLAKIENALGKVANIVGSQRHLVAIRDAFIAMLPITMVGSLAVLINVFIRDLPNNFALDKLEQLNLESINQLTGIDAFIANIPVKLEWLITINGMVWWGSLAMMALIFAFSFGYNLMKAANHDGLAGGLVSVCAFITTIPQSINLEKMYAVVEEMSETTIQIKDGVLIEPVSSLWGYIGQGYVSATGLFAAIIIVLIVMEVYKFFLDRKITIKMPASVPPAVSKAFTAIIPAIVGVYLAAAIAFVFEYIIGTPLNDIISEFIQKPLQTIGQTYPAVFIVTVLQQLLWFVGIHGSNILTPVFSTIWEALQYENADLVSQGLEPIHMWVKGSFDIYGNLGGSGATIGLVISFLIFGRRQENKTLGKLCIGPSIFNINEPVIFGVPIVLNTTYLIPWILAPLGGVTIGYFMTQIGFAGPVVAAFPWVLPPVISAFVGTAGNMGAVITSVLCVIWSIAIWTPFVFMAERQASKADESNESKVSTKE